MLKYILIIFLLFPSSIIFAQEKVCILSLFADYSKEDQLIRKSFYNKAGELLSPNLKIYHQASLEEIHHCFSDLQYEEVVFIAHGMSKKQTGGILNYGFPIYFDRETHKKSILYTRFFTQLSQLTLKNTSLKKVRIAVCGINFEQTDEVYSTIDYFIQALHSQGITVELSPKSNFISFLANVDVTRMTKSWLRKSIQPTVK